MTHKCFKCSEKFKTSAELVLHMRESHSSFVKDAQEKIDHAKQRSNQNRPNYASTCQYCNTDYQTRKKLMAHLECEHKDNEPDDEAEEPQVKIVRLSGEHEQFMQELKIQTSSTNPSSSGPKLVEQLLNAIENEETQDQNSKMRVTASTVKFPEKRYKCFWCEASFRKRGKLMDHIDMFHKANKQQSEVEAEKLLGSIHFEEKSSTSATATVTKVEIKSTVTKSTVAVNPLPFLSTKTVPAVKPVPTPLLSSPVPRKKDRCLFTLLGNIREVSTFAEKRQSLNTTNSFKFYNGQQSNPLIGTKPPLLVLPTRLEESAVVEEELAPSTSDNSLANVVVEEELQTTSETSTLVSPTRDKPPSSTASMYTFLQLASGINPLQSFQSSYSRIPFLLPQNTDMYNMAQQSMLLERQRSQYLNYMQRISSMNNSYDPNTPLDLTTHKFF